MTGAETYARWVLAPENAIETGRLIKLACQRFIDDLQRADMYFDEEEAVKMCAFGENHCVQWEGDWRGKPIQWELWQRFILEQIFGWFWTETKTRRFEEVYVQIAKKNGKSTKCAVLSLYHVFADERVNTPKVFTAANNEEQAKICVNMAGRIIQASPDLADYVDEGEVKLSTYGINITEVIHKSKDGFIKAMSKEGGDKTAKTSGGKHGINASLGITDEFGMSPDHGASKAIKTSMASRREGLMFTITTAGFNLAGPCYQENRKVGIQVLEGIIKKDNYLPIIFEIDPPVNAEGKPEEITATWLLAHPEVWRQANPNIDVSVHRKFLRGALEDAIQYGGTTAVDNLTLNFNIWMHSADVFVSREIWAKNTHSITEEDLLGQPCYGGIEFISSKMLNAFCLVFPDIQGKTVVKPVFWMPHDLAKESDDMQTWVKAGLINTDVGNVFDNDLALDLIIKELDKYAMDSFAFKKGLEHSDIVQSLIKAGYTGAPISHGVQGISTPTVIWEGLLNGFQVEHFGNPVLAWQNSNCLAKRKDNDIRLEKSGSKVVGIYAAINAVAQWKTIEADGGGEIGILCL
jgi:phage terminase large subunit-like protein